MATWKPRNPNPKRWVYKATVNSLVPLILHTLRRNTRCTHSDFMLERFSWKQNADGGGEVTFTIMQCDPYIHTYDPSLVEIRKFRVYEKARFRDVCRIHALIRLAKRQAREQIK